MMIIDTVHNLLQDLTGLQSGQWSWILREFKFLPKDLIRPVTNAILVRFLTEMLRVLSGLVLATLTFFVVAAAPPTVKLDNGNFTGIYSKSRTLSLFLGIPFAQPPWVFLSLSLRCLPCWYLSSISVADLRFRLPKPIPAYSGNHNATKPASACPQSYGALSLTLQHDDPNDSSAVSALSQSEDCTCLIIRHSC